MCRMIFVNLHLYIREYAGVYSMDVNLWFLIEHGKGGREECADLSNNIAPGYLPLL